jgi:hypothetical protein
METKEQLVITSNDEWSTFWKNVHAGVMPMPDAPAIDFSKEMVVAVMMGRQGNGGHEVNVTGIVEDVARINVYFQETSPGRDCLVTEALTYPLHVVKMMKTPKPFSFQGTTVIRNCD